MDNLIAATVTIGDRSYRLKLDPADEEIVRSTVKVINDKVVEYKTEFAGKDMQDYIAMVLLWLATERRTSAADHARLDSLNSRLDALERLLDEALETT